MANPPARASTAHPAPAVIEPTLAGLHPVELEAMRRDGEIVRLGIPGFEFYLPLGVVPTPEHRAASLAPIGGWNRVVTGAAAAWVHAGGAPPARGRIARRTRRAPLHSPANVDWCQGSFDDDEVCAIGPILVTTRARTRRDLEAVDA